MFAECSTKQGRIFKFRDEHVEDIKRIEALQSSLRAAGVRCWLTQDGRLTITCLDLPSSVVEKIQHALQEPAGGHQDS